MEKWNNFHQNDTGIVYFQPNASNRKQLRANGRKRFPFLQSWGTNLNNFQHNQIGSRRVRIVSLNKFPLSNPLAEHGFSWFWVFFQFLGQFGGSGLSGNEWEKQNIWLSLVNFFCQFLDLFCDCSSCPLLFFRGARHLQYLQNNFSPGETPKKKTTWLSSRGFPNFASAPLFLPYSLHFLPKNSRWPQWEWVGNVWVSFVF